MNRALFALGLCMVLTACPADKAELTQVMVEIDAQTMTRARATNVDFEVRADNGKSDVEKWELRLRQNVTPGSGVKWPLEVALVPKDGDADRVFLAIATARDKDGEAIAQVRAIGGYQRGKVLTLLLLIEDACLDKADLCDPEQTCRRGECVDAHVNAKSLPGYEQDDAGNAVLLPFWTDGGTIDGMDASSGGKVDGGTNTDHDASVDGGAIAPGGDCKEDDDCDDEDPCNGTETCSNLKCVKGTAFKCPAIKQPCLENVCVASSKGKPLCQAQNSDEGKTCQKGDESSSAKTSCSRDYECTAGECEPKKTETCEATQCQTLAGCDAADGCVYTPKPATTDCDDGNACTKTDKCSGTDGTCGGMAYSCDDTVGCTVDACDGVGGCTNTVSDALCNGPCKTGTCDASMGCLNTVFSNDFIDCSDGKTSTTKDMCYRGECVGGKETVPTGSCAVAGCGCSGFGSVKDLEYNTTGEFVGLIDATQQGDVLPCTNSTISIVYTVAPTTLTAYTTDTDNGAISEAGYDLSGGYVVSNTHVGFANATTHAVDWVGNSVGDLVAGKTITSLRGINRHSEGNFAATSTNVYWIWGADSGTTSSSRVVRCTFCSTILSGGCPIPASSCTDASGFTTSSIASVLPYGTSGKTSAYGGVLELVNLPSGTPRRRLYEDGTGKDYAATSIEVTENDGAWSGALKTSVAGQVLVFGSGTNNLRLCNDSTNSGDTTCTAISGLPNQSVRSYTRAAIGSGNTALFLLANNGSNYYIELLPSGLDPAVGANWREIAIANSGTTTANAIAAGPKGFMVLGKTGASPYVWSWNP